MPSSKAHHSLAHCCLQTTHSYELNMYANRPLKYFSTFSGIGGFELGIERAFDTLGRTERMQGRLQECSSTNLEDQRGLLGAERADAQPRQTEPQIQQRRERPVMEEGRSILSANERAERAVHCVGFSEIDKYAIQVYQRHFPEHTNYGDITKIDAEALPDFDLFVGGFPCQAFSIAGLRKGFADTRGTLFFDIARILDARRPLHFVLENVKGLLSHDDGRTFKTIITTLVELGYGVEWQVLNSKDFGVPQNRERVFIVGHLSVEPGPQVFPFGDSERFDTPSRFKKGAVDHAVRAKQGGPDCDQDFIVEPDPFVNQRHHGFFKGSSHNYAPSIRGASVAQNVYVNNIRRLTPVECERLQGFPDNWTEGVSDTQRYKCLGNAVTTNVIEAVMTQLYGEDTCSTSKKPPMTNSRPPAKKSTSVFGSWKSVPFKNSKSERPSSDFSS